MAENIQLRSRQENNTSKYTTTHQQNKQQEDMRLGECKSTTKTYTSIYWVEVREQLEKSKIDSTVRDAYHRARSSRAKQ